ncbi:MAG TPA: hypothetical protein VG819_14270 [Rhizomicrobium sp.]|jgi:hypothetical protein|nr:hypothetical protein [Rhizomicrobium sp.]
MTSDWMMLSYLIAIALIVIVIGAAVLVLWLIFRGKIDLSQVLTEAESAKASLSRFQFLLFTFVIAGLFLLLSVESGAFVNIPDSVLMLLGISAGSYAISKGITANAGGARNAATSAAAHAAAAQATAAAHAAEAHAASAKAAAEKAGP